MPATMTQKEIDERYEEVEKTKAEAERADIDLRVVTKQVAVLSKEHKKLDAEMKETVEELTAAKYSLMKLKVSLKEKEETADRTQDTIQELQGMCAQASNENSAPEESALAAEDAQNDVPKVEMADQWKPGTLQLNFEDTLVDFFVPPKYTFGQLLEDATRYFQVDKSLVSLEDEQSRVWASVANVRDQLSLSKEASEGKTPFVFMRTKDLEKPPEEAELEEFKSTRAKSMNEIAEEIDAAAAALIAEQQRRQDAARKELLSYLIFLVAFMFVIIAWRDTQENYFMRNSIQVSLLEEDFPLDVAHFQKDYFDIANGEELFQYLRVVMVDQIDWGDPIGGTVATYNHLIGGIRLRQLRVGDGSCKVPTNYDKFPDMGCYAPYSAATNSNRPFGPGGRWKASAGGVAKAVTGKIASYGSGGFILDYPLNQHNFTMALQELEENEWIDQGTRVVFIEMMMYNLNINLFEMVQIIVEFSAGGLAYPWVRFLPLKIQTQAGFWTGNIKAIMQLIYAVYILIFTKKCITELIAARAATEPPNIFNFFLSGWNVMDFLIISFAYVFAILLLLYQSDPQAQAFNLEVRKYTDMFPVAEYAEMITQINAISCLLVYWKMLKYFNLSTRFEIMTNTLLNSLPSVATFLIMFAVVFLAYAAMSMLLYGHALQQYSTLGRTMVTLFLVTLGDFDYIELMDITQDFTPVYFFSFVIIVFFIMLNMFIGIIADSYATENAKPKVTLGSEFAAFLKGVQEGITQPVKDLYNKAIEIAEKVKAEEAEFRRKMEAKKKRAELGKSIMETLIEKDLESLAARIEPLWAVPIEKFPDYTLADKLVEYECAANQLKPLIEDMEEDGFLNGVQTLEMELEEMANLMKELNACISETAAAKKIEDKENAKAQNETEKAEGDADVKEEANPLLEPEADKT